MTDLEGGGHSLTVDGPIRSIRSRENIRPLVTHFGNIWRASIEGQVVEALPGGNIGDLLVSAPNNWRQGIIVAHTEIMEQLKR
jgi:hypothetical protein